MTPQIKLVLIGAVAGAVAKFGFSKDNTMALIVGLSAISAVAILTAQTDAVVQTPA